MGFLLRLGSSHFVRRAAARGATAAPQFVRPAYVRANALARAARQPALSHRPCHPVANVWRQEQLL